LDVQGFVDHILSYGELALNEALEAVCDSLDELTSLVLNSWTNDGTLNEAHGWHHPAMTRHDLAEIPSSLAARIREANPDNLEPELVARISDVPRRLQLLQSNTVPNMFNGNGHQAVPAFTETINWLSTILEPLLGWQILQDNKAMPAPLARRLRGIHAELETLVPNKERLQEQIRQIQDATDAAESLPTDMQSLREARKTISTLSTDSAKLYGEIDGRNKDATEIFKKISEKHQEADKLVEQCEEAYRSNTTKGLAAAFDQRASRLSMSMWVWVGGLLSALAVGAYLGANRIELLSRAVSEKEPQWGVIWMHIVLSMLSLGAPLWFAWLSTKQIGQRFRLAEDYGYKASVAKAYEGYRREAARIDPGFEARLFSSALTRLEEAPLRLVEGTSHGSPWHELAGSEAFQKAIAAVPELKDKLIEVTKAGMSKTVKAKTQDVTKSELER